jgi:sterol desaturase/sphingolipid hydroxylase (fatty acid hydroxylase superfamily)
MNPLDAFALAQQWLYEALLQPAVQTLGLADQAGEVYDGAGWLLAGLLQLLVIAVVLGLLERWRPVEAIRDRAAIRTDWLYTAIERLGLLRVLLFFTLDPLVDALAAQSRLWGWQPWNLDAVWPGVSDIALVSFLLYLVVFDFVGYWLHRGQHAWAWWWALHAVHHSQRQMSRWSDSRNHVLDSLLLDTVAALLALLLGAEPAQFMALVLVMQLSESLQHANLRLRYGGLERVFVSPHFHRLHHAIGIGHEGLARGHNFGVLLSCWDHLFGTALDAPLQPTGIRDQLDGRDYGRGFIAQQILGVQRLWQALIPR